VTLSHRTIRTRIALTAGLSAALLIAGPALSASASSPTFDLTASSGAVEIKGSVTFNSNGTATVAAVGYDNAADGYGPYLRETASSSGGSVGPVDKSCAAGNGGHCTIPSTTFSTSGTITSVTVQACTGAGGSVVRCGSSTTLYR
jgi:hypothetical protein